MIFTPTCVPGVFLLDLERHTDDRGFFARVWCPEELRAHGLSPNLAQVSVSFNHRRGTLRGMHYQAAPHEEAKLVRCVRGAIYDVALDLRPESPTFKRWVAAELSADNRRMLYIPEGCAHGFQTLTDEAEVHYLISVPYEAAAGRGVRWDDPAFGIDWPPAAERVIAPRDAGYPDFRG